MGFFDSKPDAALELERNNAKLLEAAVKGDEDGIIAFLHLGADVQHVNKYGFTALQHAAKEGMLGAVKLLVARGADVDAQSGDENASALHYAALGNSTEVVRLLLDKGADRSLRMTDLSTPIACAEQLGYDEVAAVLRGEGEGEGDGGSDSQGPLRGPGADDVAAEGGAARELEPLAPRSDDASGGDEAVPAGVEFAFAGQTEDDEEILAWKAQRASSAAAGEWASASEALEALQVVDHEQLTAEQLSEVVMMLELELARAKESAGAGR